MAADFASRHTYALALFPTHISITNSMFCMYRADGVKLKTPHADGKAIDSVDRRFPLGKQHFAVIPQIEGMERRIVSKIAGKECGHGVT